MQRPWVQPAEVKEYSESAKVAARSDVRLAYDIARAERYVIYHTHNRWIPVVMDSAVAESTFTKTKLPNSVSELYDLYQNAESSMLVMNLPAERNKYVAKCCGFNTQFRLEFGKNQIYSILSRVKNNILDWALTLEESGIVGRDYSFSEEEKKIAQEKTEITNYITNFWGTATDVQMQQGNVDSLQDK